MFFTGFRNTILAGLCLTLVFTFAPTAAAQTWDRATKITIDQPFGFPGVALPAGTYVIRLADTYSTRTVVELLNEDLTKHYAYAIGIPAYRDSGTEESEFTFYEAEPGVPVPLRTWFYRNNNYGVEFLYPKGKPTETARLEEIPLPAELPRWAEFEEGPLPIEAEPHYVFDPVIEEAAALPAAPEYPLIDEAALIARLEGPGAIDLTRVPELPRTASPIPLIGLLGFLAAGAAGGLRALRTRKG
jgi:hypothetical protein